MSDQCLFPLCSTLAFHSLVVLDATPEAFHVPPGHAPPLLPELTPQGLSQETIAKSGFAKCGGK